VLPTDLVDSDAAPRELNGDAMVYTVKFSASPPSHSAYVEDDGTVVVEWYDLAKDRPYESASMLLSDAHGQREMIRALGLPSTADSNTLVDSLGERFNSYFAIREFADTKKVPHELKVDFDP
jgi:hypothetical protein